MSYLVLARKYRPRNFSEMVGQEHVVQALSNALGQQRLHHAYLFTGTRGVGKTTVARILAKSLNCIGADGQGGITATPCGVCPACTAIDAGRFVDYTELDAASNRGVDEVQGLLEQAVYKPVQGRFKVFMIDEVHMLTNTAFNAMLKTLEEPPEYLKFVLATTDPQKVPVTVLSRCLQFNLRPMAPEVVLQHLEHVLAQESVPAERQALRLLARAARGSMRDALSLADQAIAFGNGQLQEAAVRQMLGSADRDIVLRLIEALAQGDGKAVVQLCDELRTAGLNAASMLEDMAAVLQRMAVRQAAPGLSADESDPEVADIARLAAALPADETQLLYSLCIHGRAELGFAPDEYAGLVMTLLRLLPFKAKPAPEQEKKSLKAVDSPLPGPAQEPSASSFPRKRESMSVTPEPAPMDSRLRGNDEERCGNDEGEGGNDEEKVMEPDLPPWEDLTEAGGQEAAPPARPKVQPLPVREAAPLETDNLEEKTAITHDAQGQDASEIIAIEVRESAAAPTASAPADAPEPPAVRATGEGDFWHKLVRDLVTRDAVSALARELALQAQLVARTGPDWTLRVENAALAQSAAAERLQEALHAAGHPARLKVEVGAIDDSPARRNAIAGARRRKAAEALLMADPFVQEMVRDFGAKIVPASVKAL
ncbi:MAG: DNA polymerase III subunit gamma/tau [Burkholderiaceae bacterium]|jgi:DNA polymerase-3 subunit gamma/tau|nr:DNA polymerase III subunit gamma/tau [Burkholderiaceae bacterium]